MIIHIRIFGRVQGVGFRAWAVRQADELSLSGWVRNRIDGSVEIMADGPVSKTDEFLIRCQKGPLLARVDRVMPVGRPDAPIPVIQAEVFRQQPTV